VQGAPTNKKALIVGGGIAGLVLAMFLERAGVDPVVYEGRPEPDDEAGAFLNLAPNGLAVLDALGIREEIEALGTPTTSIAFHNHRGKKLGENPERTVLLKRGLLNRSLREAAVRLGISIEFGKRLTGVEVTPRRTAVACFEDGTEAEGDLLVGCDGINSRTRRSVFPGAPEPRYTGVLDCGAFTRTPSVPPSDGVMRMTFGLKGFFGYQTVPSGEIYWFENFRQTAEPDRDELRAIPGAEFKQKLLEVHEDDHAPIAEIIRSTGGSIDRWPLYEMPPVPKWHEGPVCLVGDAAHATTPHVGQGASMAIEDAIVLAKCLRDVPNTEEAFAAYERIRKERVEKVVEFARRTGNHKSPSGAFGRRVRDLVLPFFLKMGVKATEPVYSHRVDWDEKVAIG
jgi:2-polyprenyl-6-methoxyphenol hydroxylase-like FAD-dependent oxidoreductase